MHSENLYTHTHTAYTIYYFRKEKLSCNTIPIYLTFIINIIHYTRETVTKDRHATGCTDF